MLDPLMVRGLERLLIVLFGGLSIYFGYRLFDRAIAAAGELSAKGAGYALTLKRVAPGVFFALFGMVVMVVAISVQLKQGQTDSMYAQEVAPTIETPKESAKKALFAISEVLRLSGSEQGKQFAATPGMTSALVQLDEYRALLVDQAYGEGTFAKYQELRKDKQALANVTGPRRKDFEELRTLYGD